VIILGRWLDGARVHALIRHLIISPALARIDPFERIEKDWNNG